MTDFLFAMPSFARGAAQVLDIGGTLDVYNISPNGHEADCRALQSDWRAIGKDMWSGLEEAEKNQSQKSSK